ncbi:MAG: family 16 glycosylhydrolase [Clostridiales bacterium]|nr:family 16 glycosylhydrolase [Clostridiales bacterium]
MNNFPKRLISVCLVAVTAAGLFGCVLPSGGAGGGTLGDFGSYTGINDKIADFTSGPAFDVFRASSGYGNGGMFDCDWTNNNAVYSGETESLNMKITNGGNKIYGAEYQSHNSYDHGYFSARLKAIKRNGIVTSFFTYTSRPQWDEIDIEILGKDTTKVQFNYFTNGVGKHEFLYDLGFDASEGFHEYGFKWESDKITWYVDGKGVYCVTENIPVSKTQIMFNVWNGKSEGESNIKNWLGVYDKSDYSEAVAEYKWVAYREL